VFLYVNLSARIYYYIQKGFSCTFVLMTHTMAGIVEKLFRESSPATLVNYASEHRKAFIAGKKKIPVRSFSFSCIQLPPVVFCGISLLWSFFP